jgi:hypothetical protein
MKVEVIYSGEETTITVDGVTAKVSIGKPVPGTAFALGTLYKDDRGFSPEKLYLFQAMNEVADAENLKGLAVFFFCSLLDTDLYVVEIPRDSALFPQEAHRIFGTQDYERAI